MLKISVPRFLPLFWWKSHERHVNGKNEIVFLFKLMTKTSQLNDIAGKSKEDVFRRVLSPKWPFQMAAWRGIYMDCKYLLEFFIFHAKLCKILIKSFEWSFKFFLVINFLSKTTRKEKKGVASMLKQTRKRKTGCCRLWHKTSSEGWH